MEQREGRYSFYSSQLLATLFHHHSSDNKALAKERYFGIECWDEASATSCSSLPGIAGKLPFVALCLGMAACSACLYVCMSVRLSVCPSIRLSVCTHAMYMCMQICRYTAMYRHVPMYVSVCVHIKMYQGSRLKTPRLVEPTLHCPQVMLKETSHTLKNDPVHSRLP